VYQFQVLTKPVGAMDWCPEGTGFLSFGACLPWYPCPPNWATWVYVGGGEASARVLVGTSLVILGVASGALCSFEVECQKMDSLV
jgi:hypothetical protein